MSGPLRGIFLTHTVYTIECRAKTIIFGLADNLVHSAVHVATTAAANTMAVLPLPVD